MKRNKINLMLLNSIKYQSFILNLSIWKIISNLKVCGDVVFSPTLSYIFDALKFTYYKKKLSLQKVTKLFYKDIEWNEYIEI